MGFFCPHRASGGDDKIPIPCYLWPPVKVAVMTINISQPEPSRRKAIEDWLGLDHELLHNSRSHQVCMTCHFFRHHPGANGIRLLTCQLHQGLIAHGEHLTRSCNGWTADLHRQRGLAAEAA